MNLFSLNATVPFAFPEVAAVPHPQLGAATSNFQTMGRVCPMRPTSFEVAKRSNHQIAPARRGYSATRDDAMQDFKRQWLS